MLYRAPAQASLRIEQLGELTAIYHRASGITHLVAEPVPELLAALSGEPLTERALLARLAERFDLADSSGSALAARLVELVEAGLIEAMPARP